MHVADPKFAKAVASQSDNKRCARYLKFELSDVEGAPRLAEGKDYLKNVFYM